MLNEFIMISSIKFVEKCMSNGIREPSIFTMSTRLTTAMRLIMDMEWFVICLFYCCLLIFLLNIVVWQMVSFSLPNKHWTFGDYVFFYPISICIRFSCNGFLRCLWGALNTFRGISWTELLSVWKQNCNEFRWLWRTVSDPKTVWIASSANIDVGKH